MNQIPEELQQRIAAYIDGDLSPAEAARLEVFLANTDPALADTIVGMLADKVQLRALPKPHAPADLAERIMEQVERTSLLRDDNEAPRRQWWQSRAAIAAGLAVVLGGFSYFVASSVLRPPTDQKWTASGPAAPGPAAPTALAEGTPDRPKLADAPRDESPLTKTGAGELAVTPATTQISTEPPVVGGALAKSETPSVTLAPPATAPATRAAEVFDQAATQLASGQSRQYPNESLVAPSVAPGGFGGAAPAAGGFGGAGGAVGGGGGGGGRGGRGGGGAGFAGGGAGGGAPGGAAGGGAGGAGGAAGGRGGAGARGAGRAAPIPPSPAPTGGMTFSGGTTITAGMQSIPPTTDNSVRALADIVRDGRGPMIVTFFAQNDQDYAKLAAALASYANANLRQNYTAVLANGPQPLANVTNQEDPRNGVRQQPLPPASNYLNRDANPNYDNQSIVLDNNGSVTVLTNAGSNGANTTANTADVTNANGAALSGGALGVNNANGTSRSAQFNNQLPSNGINGTPPTPTQMNSQLYPDENLNSNNFQSGPILSNANRATQLNIQQAPSRGGPYRVALRADQLEELARNYRLAVVARGDTVVQLHALGDQAPLTADPKERDALLKSTGLYSDTSGDSQLAQAAASAPRAAAAVRAAPAAPALAPPAAAPVPMNPIPAAAQDKQNKDAPVTIECVITIEPAPPAAAARPAPVPAAQTNAP